MTSNRTSSMWASATADSGTGFCTRILLPKERPSTFEVFGPPFLLGVLLVFGLLTQYMVEVRKKRKGFPSAAYLNKKGVELPESGIDDWSSGSKLIDRLLENEEFLSSFDKEVICEMRRNTNNIRELLLISMPAATSLVLTGLCTLCQDVILQCLWPRVERPDINTAISCFLAPAGLVYALSFGFMFQNAIQKQTYVTNKITEELSFLDQAVTMTVKLNLPTKRHIMAMCKAVKAEVIGLAILVQKRKLCSYKNIAPANLKVQVWSLIDILRDAVTEPSYSLKLNSILASRMIDHVLQLNSICSDRMGTVHTRIHPAKWAFLEILGVITLYGVMLVDAQSYIFETTICNLTLYSISMLCYVLADLDSPFDGFFKVDMGVLYEVLKRAEIIYTGTKDGVTPDLTYVKL